MGTILKEFKTHLKHRLICQAYLISYPKCGRTWVNSILSHYLLRHYRRISEPRAFKYGYSMVKQSWFRRFPNICFTHDVSSPAIPFTEYAARFDPSRYINRRSMVLVRDPRDVVVSHYYHAKKKAGKNKLPADISLHDFMHHDAYGLRSIIAFHNLWPSLISSYENISWCKYEDLHADAEKVVKQMLMFFGASSVNMKALEWAIEQTNFNRFQKRELRKRSREAKPVGKNELRVRKGVIGGYREEMQITDMDYANKLINEELDPLYGYS
jgi:hypothetical protein